MRRWSWILVLGFLAFGAMLAIVSTQLESRFVSQHNTTPVPGRRVRSRRIVCLAPNVTETVFALGAGDRVVGVTDFCEYPPAAREKTRVGGPVHPSIERITVLRPDLLLAQLPNARVMSYCREHQVPFIALEMRTIAGVRAGILRLGDALECRQTARDLVESIDRDLDAVRSTVQNRPRPRVLITIGRRAGDLSGVYTIGPGSFLDELLAIAGGDNIFDDARRPYPEAGKEAIQRRAPEIIIETLPGMRLTARLQDALIRDWQALSGVPAVRTKRVFFVSDPAVQIPGPRLVRTAERLARICHPDAFH